MSGADEARENPESVELEEEYLEEEEWEIEEGIPQSEDPFLQKYFKGRDALIQQERKQRSDHAFREALSPIAADACAIVSRIRREELERLWTSSPESSHSLDHESIVFPGMMSTLAKDRMEKSSELYKILQRFPKGALLHAHMDAMVDIGWLIDTNLQTAGICMYAPQPLVTPKDLKYGEVAFVYRKAPPTEPASMWNPSTVGPVVVPIGQAADSFPNGGRPAFKQWLQSRCTITLQESIRHDQGTGAIWKKFASCFPIINSLLFYEPIFRAAIRRLLRELLDDNIRYSDFRLAFNAFSYYKEGHETPEDGYEQVFCVFGEEISKLRRAEGDGFYGARIIWTTLRSFDRRQIVSSMQECIALKKKFPQLIAGFDLVGQEDLGRPLSDLTPELFWFRKRCVEEGVEIPFFFHAGECLGDGDDTDHNLFDAILLGTRRIGHGFSLFKHPLLIEMVKDKKILIESCPISNEVLRLARSIMSHPLPALLARGVAAALCNDDPAVLGTEKNGLTHDFWQALIGWDNLGLEGLASLAENSVRWACFEDEDAKAWNKGVRDGILGTGIKAQRLKSWRVEFEKFCEWIVDAYGERYGQQCDEADAIEGGAN